MFLRESDKEKRGCKLEKKREERERERKKERERADKNKEDKNIYLRR